jgi:hypothetical protein
MAGRAARRAEREDHGARQSGRTAVQAQFVAQQRQAELDGLAVAPADEGAAVGR